MANEASTKVQQQVGAATAEAVGYLLLPDGQVSALFGLEPAALRLAVSPPHVLWGDPVRAEARLTQIVARMGFEGGMEAYEETHWPALQRFLSRHACGQRADLFLEAWEGSESIFFPNKAGPTKRQLADRIFFGETPKRVFLGYGVDWSLWDAHGPRSEEAPDAVVAQIKGDPQTAWARAEALYSWRWNPIRWGFLDNRLVAGALYGDALQDQNPWLGSASHMERRSFFAERREMIREFRAVFDCQDEGWVDILPYNERLAILRAHDGSWDFVWRDYRDRQPGEPAEDPDRTEMWPTDAPSVLRLQADRARRLYFQEGLWEEKVRLEAWRYFVENQPAWMDEQLNDEAALMSLWLEKEGQLTPARVKPLKCHGEVPAGFKVATVLGRRLAISELITQGEFRQMLLETGSSGHLHVEGELALDRAVNAARDDAPVSVTWTHAMAFTAWYERKLGVSLRLPHKKELESLNPFVTEELAQTVALWAVRGRRPPHLDGMEWELYGDQATEEIPRAVSWWLPAETGQRRLAHEVVPEAYEEAVGWGEAPRGEWRAALPWVNNQGLLFVDAIDVYEWAQEQGPHPWAHGRYWAGWLEWGNQGTPWAAKVGFRLVLELGG